MDKELRKRLEEAAIKSWTQGYREHQFKDCYPSQEGFYKRGFSEGVDWMLKECREKMIEQCKKWLKEHLEDDEIYYKEEELCWIGRDELLSDFEADMNKFFEENKQ